MLVRISDRLRDSEKVLSLCHTLETLRPDLLDHSTNVAKGKALARLGLTEDAQSYLLA